MNVNVIESTKLEEQDSTIPRGASHYRHRYACQYLCMHTTMKGSGSFWPIPKSAHVNFGPCQFRPINFVNLDFCKRDDILLKIFKIDK